MQREIELMCHILEVPGGEPSKELINTVRKGLRQAADGLVHDALLKSDKPALEEHIHTLMRAVAGTVVYVAQRPEVEDFVYAAKSLIETGQHVMDKGLRFGHPEDIRIGAVMIQLACYGVCYALDFAYFERLNKDIENEKSRKVH